MSQMINEHKLFSNVIANISSPEVVVEELVENARRADAKTVRFDTKGTILTVCNDGEVLEDFSKLLILADSEYNEAVCQRENPAGMGVYLILASTVSATFKSGYKTLTVESQRLFNDEVYRNSILDSIVEDSSSEYIQGFHVTLDLGDNFESVMSWYISKKLSSKMAGWSYVDRKESRYQRLENYLDIDIVINKEIVEKKNIDFIVSKDGENELAGLKIGIAQWNRKTLIPEGFIYWHGKRINCKEIAPFTVIVSDNHIFKPQLPDRQKLINSIDELGEIKLKIETQLFEEVQKYLNIKNPSEEVQKYKQTLLKGLCGLKYNTDNIELWDGFLRDDIIKNNGIFIVNDRDLDYKVMHVSSSGTTESLNCVEIENMKDTLENSFVYSLTKLSSTCGHEYPQWVKDRLSYSDNISFEMTFSDKDVTNNALVNKLKKCQAIKIKFSNLEEEREISTLFYEWSERMYLTEFDLEGIEDYMISESEDCERSYEEIYDDFEYELTALSTLYFKEVDFSKVIASINKFLVSDGIENKVKSFNFEDGKINGLTTENEHFCYDVKG